MSEELVFKINIVGTPSTVITNFIHKINNWKLPNTLPSTGVDVTVNPIDINAQSVKFLVFQPGGEKIHKELRSKHYDPSFACICAFDKSNWESFETVEQFYQEFVSIYGKNALCLLLGIINKRERVKKEEGEKLAEKLRIQYHELANNETEKYYQMLTNIALHYLGVMIEEKKDTITRLDP